MLTRRLLALLVSILLIGGDAFAVEPSAEDRETARALMQQGDQAAAREDYGAALEAFQGAHAIMLVPSTGMEVARTLVAMDRLVEARQLALEVAAMPVQPGEPTPFARAREEAKALAASLTTRVAKLDVVVAGVSPGATVELRIDGRVASATTVHELDPGKHTIEASAGKSKTSLEVSLKAGETRRETLTLTVAHEDPSSTPPAKGSSSKRTVGFVVGGIGLAGLASAGMTGLVLLSRDSKIDENCPNKRCNAEGRELIEGSQPLLIANAVAWGVGIVGLGLGTWLVLSSDDPTEAAPATALGVTPMPGGAGVGLARSF